MTSEADRLHLLCEINSRLATFTDIHALLRDAACGGRALFDAEACAVALIDRRLPVLHCSVTGDEAAAAPPRSSRPRCYAEDQLTTTRAVLCVPVRGRVGQLGALEVVDPREGHFTVEDRVLLEALACDIVVAYEKALLGARGGTGECDLRRLGVFAGLGLVAVGLLLVLGAVFVHQALALSLADLPARPGLWPGLMLAAAGAVLIGRGRPPGAA